MPLLFFESAFIFLCRRAEAGGGRGTNQQSALFVPDARHRRRPPTLYARRRTGER